MSLLQRGSVEAGRATVREHVAAAARAAVRPPDGQQYTLEGPDELLVLLLGGGVAVGHGAADRSDALDGQLGRRLKATTGRGVRAVNLGAHDARLLDQRALASAADVGMPDLVLWCPSYLEMTETRPTASWGRLLIDLLPLSRSRVLIALELPVPTGSDAAAVAAAPIISRVNRRLRTTARRVDGLVVVAPPPVPVRPVGQPLFDADYYHSLADLVMRALQDAGRLPV